MDITNNSALIEALLLEELPDCNEESDAGVSDDEVENLQLPSPRGFDERTMLSSGGGVGYSALVVLLVSMGAAVELYDVRPEDVDDLAYQEVNDIDTGAFRADTPDRIVEDVMLSRILDAISRDQLTTKLKSNYPEPRMLEQQFTPDMKAVFKRFPAALRSQPIRPQQKWKIKKGKALGSQMVCYFKLCAFRSPH
ncbi:uncharacterized protein LOC132902436 [Amyelois transitella]|uniref:uncharacterized protein LOC132902436 n=1 Tax=Amyelois transitella TaxID=680683 RepID=UPI00299023B9|nr:uncharacterized protein LOC132902436 [Amyelois transitella]